MPAPQAQVDAAEAQIIEQSKRIEFYLTEYSVELLALKMERREFEIPAYQRADTWEPFRKDRFIESLLMGLPIPFLFFWEIPESGKPRNRRWVPTPQNHTSIHLRQPHSR